MRDQPALFWIFLVWVVAITTLTILGCRAMLRDARTPRRRDS